MIPNVDTFILKLRSKNAKLFNAKEILITPAALEKLIRQTFAEGEKSGIDSKSTFEQLFGKS